MASISSAKYKNIPLSKGNMKNFEKLVNERLSLALKFTQQEIYEVIQENIKNYYEEKVFYDSITKTRSAIPKLYDRSYQFLNSLIKTNVTIKNGVVSCSVEIDTDSLDYLQDPETVIDMINRGLHADKSLNDGDYQTPRNIYGQSHFWDDSLEQLGGYDGILNIMKRNCKKVGIPIS